MDRSLKFAVLPDADMRASSRELIGGLAPTTALDTLGTGMFGPTLKSDGSATWNIWDKWAGSGTTIATFTMVAIVQPISGSGRRCLVTLGGGGSLDALGLTYQGTNNAFGFDDNSSDYGTNGTAAMNGKHYVMTLTKSGTAKKVYQDGVQTVSVTSGNNPATLGSIAIGANSSATSDAPGACAVSLVMIFDRLFSASEVMDISKLLRPVSDLDEWPMPYYVAIAAAGSFRRNALLNGLGASGPFYHNPLG